MWPFTDDIVMYGKPFVDKCAEVLPNLLESVPIRDAEITNSIRCKAIETPAKRLVVDLFQISAEKGTQIHVNPGEIL